MLKAVIFDMDGVIADTEPGYKITTIEFLAENGITVDKDYLIQYTGVTNEEMWTGVFNDTGLSGYTIQECINIVDHKRDLLMAKEGLQPIPGVIDLIRRFHKAGYTLAIASSNNWGEINRAADTFAIRPYFDVYASGEECAHGKPHPDVFLLAAKLLEIDPAECLVIEDSKNGLKAANRAGMRSIGFNNPEFYQEGLSEFADLLVSDFDELTVKMCEALFE